MKIPEKTLSLSRKLIQNGKLLLSILGAVLIIMSLILGSLFYAFQKIALNSLAQQDAEFARQIDTLNVFTENMIQQYGLQIFYDPVVEGLLDETEVSDMECVYDMRTLNSYDRSRNFLDSIYIYNKYENYIYSTDSHILSAPLAEFPDEGAIELFKNLDAEKRMMPIRRIAFPGEENEKQYFSFLFYETNYIDEPEGSVLMLNVDEKWYVENFTRLYGQDSCILVDEKGELLTAVSSESEEMFSIFEEEIMADTASENKYLLKKYQGKEIACFYSKTKSNGWYCVRMVETEKCIPGLKSLRDGIAFGIGLGFAVLLLTIAVSLIYLYQPIIRIKAALKKSGSSAENPEEQIDLLVQESSEYKNSYILRNILEKRPVSGKLNINPPMTLILHEQGCTDTIKELIRQEAPSSLFERQHNCALVLLCGSDALRGKEICGMIAENTGCRCFCGIPRNSMSELPSCYQILMEMRRQKFWFSGQRILLEKDFSFTKALTEQTRELPANIMSALKNRNLQEAEKLWETLLAELQGSSYVEQRVVLHNLAELLEAALPELSPLADDEFFRNLNDVSELDERYKGAFKQITEHYQMQRKERYLSIVHRAEEIISNRYSDQNLSPAEIADELELSSAYLGRIFRETEGCSLSQYLNNTRVEKAKELLCQTELAVEAIAEKVGFSNAKYFYVVFKNFSEITPLQYRKRCRENC